MTTRRRIQRAASPWAFLILGAIVGGCRSSQSYRAEADEDAYRLVQSRRERLGLDTGAFTIEPDPNSLRQRIVRNEAYGGEPLTLVQCLEIAAENSRNYLRQKEALYLSALDLTLERWRFALQKGGTLDALVAGRADEAETASAGTNFSLAKLFGTGARVIGNLGIDFTRSLLGSDGWHPRTSLSLSVTQPLLAGFGTSIVREPLTQAERNLVYQARAFERFRRQLAFDVATRFYRLLQLEDTVKNQENDVANLVKLSDRNRALAESGRLSDIEVGQARQNELRSQNDLLSARERLSGTRDQFKLFLGLPIRYALALDASAMKSIEAEKDARIDYPENIVTSFALAHRLDHTSVLDRVGDAERKVHVAENALQAALALNGDVALQSPVGRPAHLNFKDVQWSLGATLALPFERLPQRNVYREALINLEAALRDAMESEDGIRINLREDLRATETRRGSYTIQVNAVELAERRIESTRLKLDAGRADTRDLLEATVALLVSQNAATGALIDYTLARLRLFLDMELLMVDQEGIRLEPGRLDEDARNAEHELPEPGKRDANE